jgi:hypothetical protein
MSVSDRAQVASDRASPHPSHAIRDVSSINAMSRPRCSRRLHPSPLSDTNVTSPCSLHIAVTISRLSQHPSQSIRCAPLPQSHALQCCFGNAEAALETEIQS